jgi:hypothetical protein
MLWNREPAEVPTGCLRGSPTFWARRDRAWLALNDSRDTVIQQHHLILPALRGRAPLRERARL